ncbi:hypothetical protein, partial [Enterococcus casseliflavus]|uniref:hypothetical protein n=1 Tax=Enterococcus casseliflavus TaxID=37734 RepID=UPI003D0F16D9
MPMPLMAGLLVIGASLGVARAPATDVGTSDVDGAVSEPHSDAPLGTDAFGRRLTVIAAASSEPL